MHRRHSSRSIKRKKFDDEVVESSLPLKPSQRRFFDAGEDFENVHSPDTSFVREDVVERRNSHKSSQEFSRKPASTAAGGTSSEKKTVRKKKMKKMRQAFAAVKDMGRWKPTDDILLIDGVTQVQDLSQVHQAVKFSCYFTLEAIQERWYALLYDPVISGLARQAMKALPREVANAAHTQALFSKEEKQILSNIPTTSQPSMDTFQAELDQNPSVFHHARTAASLKKQWELMKKYHLVNDQTIQPLPQGDHVLSFSDAEEMMDDNEIMQMKDPAVDQELKIADRKQKREIKKLEEEIPRWEVLVSSVTGVPKQEMDQHTVAVLRGRLVRYLMRSREITFGRSTELGTVDIDLSLEGPAHKISRQQGTIRMKNNGDFVIANDGKRPIYVDGKVVLKGSRARLAQDSVIEIALLRFVFLINPQLVSGTSKPAS